MEINLTGTNAVVFMALALWKAIELSVWSFRLLLSRLRKSP